MTSYSFKVLALFRAQKGEQEHTEESAIDVDLPGIENDKHFNRRPERSILITSKYSYEKAEAEGILMPYGSLGENIVVDIDPKLLKVPGTRIRFGDAVVEIVQNCTICKSLAKVDECLPELLREDRGVFAKCVQRGKISKGDTATLL